MSLTCLLLQRGNNTCGLVGGGGAVKVVRNNLYNANVVEASRVICGHEFSLVDWGGGYLVTVAQALLLSSETHP